ncbi:hypothetical protein VTN77DRAFT_4164 [Rasamsonia byssochlamydoides]|uniref:uncharacterized protein n=1 Tax=Rasamsonia byssochlamydoides TaxID=89139 RepID=UPI003742C2C7
MSSSDDDTPLVQANGRSAGAALSEEVISKATDKMMDDTTNTNGDLNPGVSIRNGPVGDGDGDVEMEDAADGANVRSASKRKARASAGGKSYAEPESSEEDKPLSKRRRTSGKKQAADSDSDDVPLAQRSNGTKPPKASETAIGEESDSDVPIERKLSKQKAKIEEKAEKEAKAIRKAEATAAAKKTTGNKSAANGKKKQANGIKKEESDEEKPVKAVAKKTAKSVKSEPATPAKKGKGKAEPTKEDVKEETEEPEGGEEGEEEEEEYRWWEDPTKRDGTIKWTTLEHNGVLFPPPYEPLPQHVKMKYDGIPVTLEPEAEEVAGFFGSMLNSTHNVENPTFQKNFFGDFQDVLKRTGGAKDPQGNPVEIKEFAKCDFRPIFEYYEMKRAEKRNLPPAEKKALKAKKEAEEAPYMYCLWDGRKQRVGNFRVEPPGLFRGRGEHPKTGKVKTRVQPEQITINIGKEAKVPEPPPGHHWKEVKHDQEGTWLAMWQENINGNYKYVMLAANSDIKGQSDYKKFEKARELKKHIDRIRKDYMKALKHELMADRQKATAVYLIDKFALRAGNEKGEDEADTVGCCSLKYEHVTLKPPNKVIFDFLGKDSIRFYDEVEVDPQVFKNLKIFKKPPKKEGDEIFDRLTTSALNKHLSSYMPGLTAKVFRTYNASYTFATLLKEMKPGGSVAEKVKAYNDANRKVAILCNHKRTVPGGHANQMEKLSDRIKGLRYQRWRVKQMMLSLDPDIKKKKDAKYFELDEDLDQEWIKEHQKFLIEEQRQKITKKFEKDNEKLAAEGKEQLKPEVLEERLEVLKEMEKKFQKENKTGKVEPEGKNPTIEKLENNILKLEQRIENMELQAEDKENNKEVALSTSKINYIDPRLTVVFSKRFNVPIEKFFSKTLREKFDWAIKSVDETWEF